jgi:predicted nucleotidyltransferase
MTEADVVEALGWLGEGEVPVWLDGGWGVDALVGEQTREHNDLDLIVRDDHVSRMSDVLHEHGFRLSSGVQGGFLLRDDRGREVDVHPVRFDDRGNGHLEEDGTPFDHPAAAFAAAGNIAGRRVACLSAEAQMTNHAWGYTPGDTDFHDMRLLNARLGTALLPPYQHPPSRDPTAPPEGERGPVRAFALAGAEPSRSVECGRRRRTSAESRTEVAPAVTPPKEPSRPHTVQSLMNPGLTDGDRGQIADVVGSLRAVLDESLIGAYLFGSAVLGGLRPESDLDILAVATRKSTDAEKDRLVDRLLVISGDDPAEASPRRAIELTIVVGSEMRPWRYPPRRDFQYGEWLREEFERHDPKLWRSKEDPDVAILVSMTLLADSPLTGPHPSDVLDPVPRADFVDALIAGIPGLMEDLDWDTRNVVLTLARIWNGLATGDVRPKDAAADWALARLSPEQGAVLERARDLYLGIGDEDWSDLEPTIPSFLEVIHAQIRSAAEAAKSPSG